MLVSDADKLLPLAGSALKGLNDHQGCHTFDPDMHLRFCRNHVK